jgi:hypothetical protein
MKMNDLSPPALKAALLGGTEGWGSIGSLSHVRYCEPMKPGERRRRCHCGCARLTTHRGMANGVALADGCELSVRRWVANLDAAMKLAARRGKLRRAALLRRQAAKLLAQADRLEAGDA